MDLNDPIACLTHLSGRLADPDFDANDEYVRQILVRWLDQCVADLQSDARSAAMLPGPADMRYMLMAGHMGWTDA